MAVVPTIAVVLGAWCAASVITAGLYTALRTWWLRRQRAVESPLDDGAAGRYVPTAEPDGFGIPVTGARRFRVKPSLTTPRG
ncbi:hypothetical protein [Streptomyces sp. NPDC048349]|uniref:hypothetical protein n=1 Tax=Streptomyces sp. NPDC048349 TaxID=3155486 RepID=UPI003426DF74